MKRDDAFDILGAQAQPRHTSIHFDVDADGAIKIARRLRQLGSHVGGVDRRAQVQPCRLARLPGWDIAEDEDRRGDARRAQRDRLAERRDAEPRGAVEQRRPRDSQRAMPVGVGLQTDQHVRLRPDDLLDPPRIASDGVEIDLQPGGAVGSHDDQASPGLRLPVEQLFGALRLREQSGGDSLHAHLFGAFDVDDRRGLSCCPQILRDAPDDLRDIARRVGAIDVLWRPCQPRARRM